MVVARLQIGAPFVPALSKHMQDQPRTQRLTGFSVILEGCYGGICKPIQSKMIALLTDGGKW